MTIIDANAYLGHWATRRLRHNTAPELLELMDSVGIARACVSSAGAIMYRNCHAGNVELHEMLAGHRERLIPCAVLSPAYAGWERDLEWCREVMGARALRLYPSYHGFRLLDGCCADLIRAATEAGMLITLTQRVEDYRQRHWLINAPDESLADWARLVAAHPEARFILTNGLGYGGSDLVTRAGDLPANYWVDLCRPDPVYGSEVAALLEALGPGRLVFGSASPFNYPRAALVRLEVLPVSASAREQIAGGNLLALLGVRP